MTLRDPTQPVAEPDYNFEAVERMLLALGRRVGGADVEALADLGRLRAVLDQAIEIAVEGLRHDPEFPASWPEIAQALCLSKGTVKARYGHLGGIRRRGGQPAPWR